jgi:regulator of protease activity HflC (stomatin/prohibitin superfamily)
VIGKTVLSDMLEGRDKISVPLQTIIDARTQLWGISVPSVEVKDVLIPSSLEDAMSMRLKLNANARPASFLANRSCRLLRSLVKRLKSTPTIPSLSISAR